MTNLELGPLILRLASRECGVASNDDAFAQFTVAQVGQRANQLVTQGTLHRARLSHRSVRWYTSKERAAKVEANRRATTNLGGPIRKEHEPTHEFADGELRYAASFKGIQYCPSHLPTLSEMDLGRVFGGNQRGRVLVAELPELSKD